MILLIFSFWIRANFTMGFEMTEKWSIENRPQLNVVCEKSERFCTDLCNQESNCSLDLLVCKDCIGSSVLLTNIFEKMGEQYRNSGASISSYELIDFIREKSFVLFSSRSIYNQLDSYDSPAMRARFQKLCPEEVEYPVVFFSLKKESSVIEKVRYVVCGSEIYSMSAEPDIIYNKNLHFIYPNKELN